MISKLRFNKIKAGDILLVNKKWRIVINSTFHFDTKRMFLTFDKVSGQGTTIYLHSDLKYKIKAILSVTSNNYSDTVNY